MAGFTDVWHKLLRAFGMGALAGSDWVQPGNAITRAIYEESAFVTMTSWEEQPATPAADQSPAMPSETAVETLAAEGSEAPRKGVAA